MATPDPLQKLEAELESVRIEFERYFLGLEKRIPGRARDEIGRKLRQYQPGDDAVSRFKHNNLLQRLLTLGRYWDRVQRSIEDGTYHRDLARADYRKKAETGTKSAVAMRGSSKRQDKAKKKAKEVGAEAAAFLENLVGGNKVGMRGTRVKSARGRSGKAVAPEPSPPPEKSEAPKIGLRGRSKRKTPK